MIGNSPTRPNPQLLATRAMTSYAIGTRLSITGVASEHSEEHTPTNPKLSKTPSKVNELGKTSEGEWKKRSVQILAGVANMLGK